MARNARSKGIDENETLYIYNEPEGRMTRNRNYNNVWKAWRPRDYQYGLSLDEDDSCLAMSLSFYFETKLFVTLDGFASTQRWARKMGKKRDGGGSAGSPALSSHLYLVQVAPGIVSRAVTEDEALIQLAEPNPRICPTYDLPEQVVLFKRKKIFWMGHHEAWGNQASLEPLIR